MLQPLGRGLTLGVLAAHAVHVAALGASHQLLDARLEAAVELGLVLRKRLRGLRCLTLIDDAVLVGISR